MAAQLPEKLKKADLHRFALRAAQLEKARPIVTYWCEYFLLQQVLGKQLHVGDVECSNYAVQLMDKLEATKAANALNDAIVDDVAAKAYIENFALETFSRADESQRLNKVTKQTADTFMAAATFMDLLSVWGDVDPEITAKSKFAKYHARRILQAFKAGEDPNASNPVVEEQEPQPPPPEESVEAELDALEAQQNGIPSSAYHTPTVEGVGPVQRQPDTDRGLPSQPDAGSAFQQQPEYQVSPLEPTDIAKSRQSSIGGGYFPATPSAPADPDITDHTSPVAPPPPPSDMEPQAFYNTLAPAPIEQPSAPSPRSLGITSPARPGRPPPDQMTAQPPSIPPLQSPPPPPQIPAQQPTYAAPPLIVPVAPQQIAPVTTGFKTDDEATMAAQKHARWAISALNFEDVNTAVKELRLALQSLGAG